MEIGDIEKGNPEIKVETSIERPYDGVPLLDEEKEIGLLKWQLELMLKTIDAPNSSR